MIGRAPVVAAALAAAAPAYALAVAACGSGSQPGSSSTPSNTASGTGATAARDGTLAPEVICDRIEALAARGCDPFTGYGLDRAACLADMRKSLESRGDDARAATLEWGGCLGESSCDEVHACIDRMESIDGGFRACNDTSSGAVVGRPRADWDRRRGAGAQRFSDVQSTKAEPIEVCEIEAELEWLMRVVCDDGSHAFASQDHAHAARVGNVGAGGTCGSIVDLYEVPCPEATYAVYMDAYVCPLPDP